jgi:uncharacterized repeat protein (TIGR01451 family)
MAILPDTAPEENNQPQERLQERKREDKKKRSLIDDLRTIKKSYDKIKQVVQAIRWIANPYAIVFLILFSTAIFALMSSSSGGLALSGETNPEPTPGTGGTAPPSSIPGLTIKVTSNPPCTTPTPNADYCVQNGEDLVYTISYTYDISVGKIPLENIVLYDTIPKGATFVSTTGVRASDSNTAVVTWSLKDPSNQQPFTITLHPLVDDTYIINTVLARAISGGTGGSTGTSTSPQEFKDLTQNQGRNTYILGDKTNFIAAIIANSSGLPLAGKESYLGQIYDAATTYNINPLILTVIWGVESGFDATPTYPFGCLNPTDTGFSENVTCAAGSLNVHMATFETHSTGGSLEIPSTTGNTCIYTDAFDYAYEKYTPVCATNDGNDSARTNFINFFKKLKGI